ncbi:hypothetical protein Ancab_023890 [Ancistrocladus abbreviatus]
MGLPAPPVLLLSTPPSPGGFGYLFEERAPEGTRGFGLPDCKFTFQKRFLRLLSASSLSLSLLSAKVSAPFYHINPCFFQGVLKGFDQATNIILDESHERVYSTKEGVQQLVLGLYIIRGDNITIIGELDEDLDARLDLSKLRAHPLKPVIH